MLRNLLLLLSFLGHSGLVAVFLNCRLETAFLLALSGYVLLLFGAAISGALHQADIILLYSGLPALLVALWLHIRQRAIGRLLLQPSLVLFLAYAVFAYLALSTRALSQWDEFTHWGLAAKMITETSALFKEGSVILVQDYPPGSALLIYHALKALGYSEGNMIFAQSFLYFVPMIAFIHGMGWKRWPELLLVLMVAYAGICSLSYGYGLLTVDCVLSLFLGAALVIYAREGKSGKAILISAIILGAVVLFKKIGFPLALIGGSLILMDQLIDRAELDGHRSRIVAVLMLFLIAAAVNYSWHSYVVGNHLGRTFSQPIAADALRQSLSSKATPYQVKVRNNFVDSILHWDLTTKGNLSSDPVKGFFALPFWLSVIVTLYVIAWLGTSDRHGLKRLIATIAVMLVGLAIYLFGLLVLYMFRFDEHEGPLAASFGRYTDVYVLAFLLTAVSAVLMQYRTGALAKAVRLATLGGVLIVLLPAPLRATIDFWLPHPPTAFDRIRSDHEADIRMVRRLTASDSAIYIIYAHTDGLPYYALSYELAPRLNNRTNYCWSIRAPGAPHDPYECDWTPEKWATVLRDPNQGFDYVWVVKADSTFWTTYGALFDDDGLHREGLYRVFKKDKSVRLWPVSGNASRP